MKIYVTNNPLVKDKIDSDKYNKVVFIDGTYKDVLIKSRTMVHSGDKLLTHPLTSSIKPNETPYKTVILENRNSSEVDLPSLEIIENSILVFDKFQNSKKTPIYIESVNQDFMLIDYDIIKN
ncbi:MAG: GrdX family protein [Lachnospirales bacterium]